MMVNDATYLGLKIYEWLTLCGVVLGPICAVGITLWIEGSRQVKDRQAGIARILMGTRHMPADQQYNGAINLIPIEFNDQPKIMAAWQEYMAAVRYQPSEENSVAHDKEVNAKQSTLIYRILRHLKYEVSESDIQTNAYMSKGFQVRDNLQIDAMVAWIRIANALERSAPTAITNEVEPNDDSGKV